MDLGNVHRLRVFVEVAEALSFSRAAQRLTVSEPAVWQRIRELEEIVGSPLFNRTGRKLALTEAGYCLLEYGKRVTDLVAEMETAMNGMTQGMAGHLVLAASPAWGSLLPDLMGSFHKARPGLRLGLTVGGVRQVADLVLRNEAHLGFVTARPEEDTLEAIPMMEDEILIVAAPGHPLACGQLVRPCDVEGPLPFVHSLTNPISKRDSPHFLETLGLKGSTVMELEGYEAVKQAVRSGIGLGVLSRRAVIRELAAGELAEVRVDAPPRTRTLYAIRNISRSLAPVQRAFLVHVANGSTSITHESGMEKQTGGRLGHPTGGGFPHAHVPDDSPAGDPASGPQACGEQ